MRNRDRALAAATLVLAAGLVVGIAQLLRWRFSSGDVYPPYSSLRADPLGAKALYQSLETFPGVRVSRNFRPIEKLSGSAGTIFYLGVESRSFRFSSKEEIVAFEAIASKGGRLVIAFQPERQQFATPGAAPDIKPLVEERWRFRLAYQKPQPTKDDDEEESAGPNETLLYFEPGDSAWQVHGAVEDHPRHIERHFGSGTIVLLANSYLLSNEAMLFDRQPALIAGLVGSGSSITFDEYHFGIAENTSVAMLARKYGLGGVFAGVLLLACLFVWQSSTSFLPPHDDSRPGPLLGKDAASGFVNLLRRSIPPARLLATCVAEWRKTFPGDAKAERIAEMALSENAVEAYQNISHVLRKRGME